MDIPTTRVSWGFHSRAGNDKIVSRAIMPVMVSLNELLDAFAKRKRIPTIHKSLTSGIISCSHVLGFGTYDAKGTDDIDSKVDITFFAADPRSFFLPFNGIDPIHTNDVFLV